jgi:hypothetical protein
MEGDNRVLTLDDIKKDERIRAYLEGADCALGALGFTEHGLRHADLVAHIAINVLKRLDYPEREAELAGIAAYLHDIGNAVGRDFHGITSALIAKSELERLGMRASEVVLIMNAIGSHEEQYGATTTPIGAAVILADKSDVHRTRVRNPNPSHFDIHDRVNFAAERSFLRVSKEERKIELEIDINTQISQVMEYFEIFLSRMVRCRRAAEFLGCQFGLIINKTKLL